MILEKETSTAFVGRAENIELSVDSITICTSGDSLPVNIESSSLSKPVEKSDEPPAEKKEQKKKKNLRMLEAVEKKERSELNGIKIGNGASNEIIVIDCDEEPPRRKNNDRSEAIILDDATSESEIGVKEIIVIEDDEALLPLTKSQKRNLKKQRKKANLKQTNEQSANSFFTQVAPTHLAGEFPAKKRKFDSPAPFPTVPPQGFTELLARDISVFSRICLVDLDNQNSFKIRRLLHLLTGTDCLVLAFIRKGSAVDPVIGENLYYEYSLGMGKNASDVSCAFVLGSLLYRATSTCSICIISDDRDWTSELSMRVTQANFQSRIVFTKSSVHEMFYQIHDRLPLPSVSNALLPCPWNSFPPHSNAPQPPHDSVPQQYDAPTDSPAAHSKPMPAFNDVHFPLLTPANVQVNEISPSSFPRPPVELLCTPHPFGSSSSFPHPDRKSVV